MDVQVLQLHEKINMIMTMVVFIRRTVGSAQRRAASSSPVRREGEVSPSFRRPCDWMCVRRGRGRCVDDDAPGAEHTWHQIQEGESGTGNLPETASHKGEP